MPGYLFHKILQLKKALTEGNLASALVLVPKVDIEEDQYQYLALLNEIQIIFLEYYKSNNQLALNTTIELIVKSKNLPFTDDWPQFTDLVSTIVGTIAEMNKSDDRDNMLQAVLKILPLKDSYVANHTNLTYNLACYYATNNDVKTMMEYVRRARFSFEPEKFLNDSSFESFKEKEYFLEPLKNIGYTMFTWWTSLWPVEEWYEEPT